MANSLNRLRDDFQTDKMVDVPWVLSCPTVGETVSLIHSLKHQQVGELLNGL
jgi:hypothetical protein